MEWISVDDRIPDFGRYLVRYGSPGGNEIVTAEYFEHNFCAGSDGNIHKIWVSDASRSISPMRGVTHWMPLPAPPVE